MTASEEAELTFDDFTGVLRRWRWAIVAIVLVATGGTAIASLVLPKKYAGIVLISPVSDTQSNGLLSGLNSMVSQVSGLASLAGLTEHSDSTKAESLAVLESAALTEYYIQQNNLLPILYADLWDAKNKRWKVTDPRKTPTLWKANQYFKKRVRNVTADSKTGLVTLTILWTDPVTAAKWANDLVKLTNEFRRDKAIQESERNIVYLTAEAAKTDVVGVRQAVYSILQTEISKAMLARGNEEYALKVVDPATPPEKPASPQPLLWTLVAFLVSVAVCTGAAFLVAAMRGAPSAKNRKSL